MTGKPRRTRKLFSRSRSRAKSSQAEPASARSKQSDARAAHKGRSQNPTANVFHAAGRSVLVGLRWMHTLLPGRGKKPMTLSVRLARAAFYIALCLAAVPLVAIPLYGVVRPPASTLMLGKMIAGEPIVHKWVPLDAISRNIKDAVILSEDGRFCRHHGVDWREVENSLGRYRRSGRLRGASTLTMQTVKNLYLWPSRSVLRKMIEVPLAHYADLVWSKRRTLELYLNSAEWGPGIFGIEAAAAHYFGKSAGKLSRREASLLAAVLPNPIRFRANRPGRRTRVVARVIRTRMARGRAYTRCVYD